MSFFAMKNFAFLSGLSRQVSALRRDQKGVSAVEFALLLPVMLTIYLGTVETSQGVAIQRKVTLTAWSVADLASRVTSINNADMTNMLTAASAVIAPFPAGELKVTVSAVSIDANGIAKVAWSDSLHGTKRAVDSTVSLPAALNVPNSQLIWSEVNYNYVPSIGYVLTGALNLFDQIYTRPRLSETVNRVSS
jgi:Flp pilus assembly protein TadG